MNFHYAIRKVMGRATCVKAPSTRLLGTARIVNISGNSDNIRLGENSVIAGEVLVFPHGGKIEIGNWCFLGANSRVWSGASISIGDRVLISHDVNIFDNLTHPVDAKARHAHFRAISTTGHPADIDLGDRPVVIEDDAWVSAGACIMRGVTVGKGAIVGAHAVVTADVPPYSIVAGNPARIIRTVDA
jgi:acetyltransferase-like isoleucine patch superfamily enzyme